MSYTVRFRMKTEDYVRLAEIDNQVLRYVFGPWQVVGLMAIRSLGPDNQFTGLIWPEWDREPLITVPLDVLTCSHTTHDDPRERVEVVYEIGSDTPIYITPADRKRHRDLEGCRAYRDRLVECVYQFEREYEDEYGVFTSCGHKPESHGPDGCKEILYWDGAGYESYPIYCPCEHYTKPAPLMVIE